MFEKLGKSLDVELTTSAQNNSGQFKAKIAILLGSGNPETLLRTTIYLIGLILVWGVTNTRN